MVASFCWLLSLHRAPLHIKKPHPRPWSMEWVDTTGQGKEGPPTGGAQSHPREEKRREAKRKKKVSHEWTRGEGTDSFCLFCPSSFFVHSFFALSLSLSLTLSPPSHTHNLIVSLPSSSIPFLLAIVTHSHSHYKSLPLNTQNTLCLRLQLSQARNR